jgi:hypothetical protein
MHGTGLGELTGCRTGSFLMSVLGGKRTCGVP